MNVALMPSLNIQTAKPTKVRYHLTPATMALLSPNSGIALQEECVLHALLEPFTISLPASDKSIINGNIDVSPIALKLSEHPLARFNLTAPFNVNLKTTEITGKLALTSDKTSLETSYLARLEEPSIYTLLPAISLQLEGQMKQFPVQLIATLTQKPELTTILGQELSGSWKLGFNNALSSQPLEFRLKGDGLELQTNLQLAKELTSQTGRDAATIDLQMTPEKFVALQSMLQLAQSEKQKEMKLSNQVTLGVRIKGIKLPLEQFVQEGEPLVLASFLDALFLDASMSVDEITLTTKNNPKESKTLAIAPLKILAQLTGNERLFPLAVKVKRLKMRKQPSYQYEAQQVTSGTSKAFR